MHARHAERGRDGPLISLVLPAYNPGPFLDRTWRAVRQFLREAPGNWEVLFVCDGCTDGSPVRLQELARTEPERVRILARNPCVLARLRRFGW